MQKTPRKLIALLLALILTLPMWAMPLKAEGHGLTESTHRLFVDGAEVPTAVSISAARFLPYNINGTTYVPARAMTLAFNRDAHWEPGTSNLYFGTRANPVATNNLVVTTPAGSHTISLEQVLNLGINPFTAVDRNNARNFTGIPLAAVFSAMGVNTANAAGFIFISADGTPSIATAAEALNPANGFLALAENDERFTAREDGGRGPFMVVFAEDGVPGRWMRMLTEIIVITENCPPIMHRQINMIADGNAVNAVDAAGSPTPAFMINGLLYMPLRAIATALNMSVGFDAAQQAIYIGSPPTNLDPVNEGEIAIVAGGVRHIVSMAEIVALGPVDFTAEPRGELRHYTGVPLTAIMTHLGLDYTQATGTVTMHTRDGHGTTGTVEEVFDPANGFVTIAQDGTLLGHWEQDGRGPFMWVFAKDAFAQRFMRYLTEIEIDMPSGPALSIVAGDATHTVAIAQLASMARPLTFNNANFTAVPFTEIASLLGISLAGLEGGDVVAVDDFTRNFVADDLAGFYVSIAEEGREPGESPFTSIFTNDTSNNRRVRNLGRVVLNIPSGPAVNIVVGGRTFTAAMADFEAVGLRSVTTATNRTFSAVPTLALMNHLGISLDGLHGGAVVAADGLAPPFTMEELFDTEHFFIAVSEEGREPLEIPFISVFAKDERASRLVRSLIEVNFSAPDPSGNVTMDLSALASDSFAIVRGGQTFTITMADLAGIGPVNFTAEGSGVVRNFTGVPLRDIFTFAGIDLAGASNLLLTARDGWETTWLLADALPVMYIAIGEDGEPLGVSDRGPLGPFYAIGVGAATNRWLRETVIITVH